MPRLCPTNPTRLVPVDPCLEEELAEESARAQLEARKYRAGLGSIDRSCGCGPNSREATGSTVAKAAEGGSVARSDIVPHAEQASGQEKKRERENREVLPDKRNLVRLQVFT